MTNRIHSLTVVLFEDQREDEVEELMKAIKLMRGVISVTGEVSDIASYMAETRARNELGQKLWHVLYPKDKS